MGETEAQEGGATCPKSQSEYTDSKHIRTRISLQADTLGSRLNASAATEVCHCPDSIWFLQQPYGVAGEEGGSHIMTRPRGGKWFLQGDKASRWQHHL